MKKYNLVSLSSISSIYLFIIFYYIATTPDDFLLITDTTNKVIYRMQRRTGSYVVIPLQHHDNPIAIDYDPQTTTIYWTDVGSKQIRSATLDGNSETTIRQLGPSMYTFKHTHVIASFVQLVIRYRTYYFVGPTPPTPLKFVLLNLACELPGYNMACSRREVILEYR